MRAITLPWDDWRAVIAVLREKALPSMLEHADHLEQQLERHGPGESVVRLSLTDDVFLRSSNWARIRLTRRARSRPDLRQGIFETRSTRLR
jgi:hypothetical protein